MSRACIYFVTQTDLLCLTPVLNLSAFGFLCLCLVAVAVRAGAKGAHGCCRVARGFIADGPRDGREEQSDRMCCMRRQKLRETLRRVHMRGLQKLLQKECPSEFNIHMSSFEELSHRPTPQKSVSILQAEEMSQSGHEARR